MAWTTVPGWTVGQKLKAATLNLAVTAIGELQDWADTADAWITARGTYDTSWGSASGGTDPTWVVAYRKHGFLVDCRALLTYTTIPSTLALTFSSVIPSGYRPENPGVGQSAALATCFAKTTPASTSRVPLVGFFTNDGSALVRGGSSNPNSYGVFELQSTFSVA